MNWDIARNAVSEGGFRLCASHPALICALTALGFVSLGWGFFVVAARRRRAALAPRAGGTTSAPQE